MGDDGEQTVDLRHRGLAPYGLEARTLWLVEYVSMVFSRSFDAEPLFSTSDSSAEPSRPIVQ